MLEIGHKNPDKWRKIAHLREIIKGRQFELKRLNLEYQEAFNEFIALHNPPTPGPAMLTHTDLEENKLTSESRQIGPVKSITATYRTIPLIAFIL